MNNLQDILTKEYLSKLEALSLAMKGKINQGAAGIRKSGAKGSSLEFSDYRDYADGDDFRRIDWNSYARSGRMHLKLFLEEKQAVINIFVDQSSSMATGDKALYAKGLAASIAYISLKDTDKVNLLAFGDGLHEKKINLQSKNAFIDAVHFLDELAVGGLTKFSRTIRDCNGISLGRGVSIMISDFLTDDNWQEGVKRLQYLKQDVILVWLLGEEDISPGVCGPVSLVDQETGERLDTILSDAMLADYQAALGEYENSLREFCRKRNVGFAKLQDNIPLLKGLNRVLYG